MLLCYVFYVVTMFYFAKIYMLLKLNKKHKLKKYIYLQLFLEELNSQAEVYLEPSRTSMIKCFCKIN